MDRKVLSVFEIADIMTTIDDLERILQTYPFNENEAREIIFEVNLKHPENVYIHNICFSTLQSKKTEVSVANYIQLLADLHWKYKYLNAKVLGKTLQEINSANCNSKLQ